MTRLTVIKCEKKKTSKRVNIFCSSALSEMLQMIGLLVLVLVQIGQEKKQQETFLNSRKQEKHLTATWWHFCHFHTNWLSVEVNQIAVF